MIVYYNPDNGSILGMSYKKVEGRVDSYIETNDPIAEKIFLGKEKSLKFHVVVRPETNEGFIKLRSSVATAEKPIKFRVIPFEQEIDHAELTIDQYTDKKKIVVSILESSHKWWTTDKEYALKKINIVACKKNNPYLPIWYIDLSPRDLIDLKYQMNYTGTDDITFYTTPLFDSYKHEIKSS